MRVLLNRTSSGFPSLLQASQHHGLPHKGRMLFPRSAVSALNNQRRRKQTQATSSSKPLKNLVIVGSGWGGYSVLSDMARFAKSNDIDVTLISERNHFLFTPLLASTTVGTLEFRSIIEPVRREYGPLRFGHKFDLATVLDVNPQQQVVRIRSLVDNHETEVPYDVLVLAAGAESRTFNIPGVAEHAFFLKEVWHAREIRNHILKNFELSSQPGVSEERKRQLLHFVVVGGGPTGVEFSAELHDFVRQDIRKLYPELMPYISVSLVEARELLSAFSPSLRSFAIRKINRRKEMQILKHNAAAVGPESITLDDGRELPCGLVVWVAGVSPRRLIRDLQFPKERNGALSVNGFLQVEEIGKKFFKDKTLPAGMAKSNIFAIGDCASIEGHPLPATAQVAQSEARWLAALLKQMFTEKVIRKEPYHFVNKGMMAYVGDYNALTQLGEAELPGGKTVRGPALRGLISWLLWRSVYLTRLGAWRLRMQVPMDWFKTFVLGRDTSVIGDLSLEADEARQREQRKEEIAQLHPEQTGQTKETQPQERGRGHHDEAKVETKAQKMKP